MEKAFARWLLLRGTVSVTNKNHLKILGIILRGCKPLTYDTFERFITGLLESGRKPATINSYICTMHCYAQFANLDDRLKKFKVMRVRDQVSKGTLSDKELEDFLSLPCPAGQDSNIWEKDRIFFSILAVGSRPNEIAHIMKADVTDSTIMLRHTKVHKPRMIPIPPFIQEELMAHINKCPTDNLFMTSKGRMYSYSKWQHSFKQRMKMLGIARPNISLYSLRTTCITNLLKKDVSVAKIGRLCGTSYEMIEKNYSSLVISDLEAAIKRLPIVSKHLKITPQEVGQQVELILKLYDISYTVKLTKHELQVKASC